MKKTVFITLLLSIISTLIHAQAGKTITYIDNSFCTSPSGTILTFQGTVGTSPNVRNTYGGELNGMTNPPNVPYRVIWSTANSRWEMQVFLGVYVYEYYNTTASKPNPPALGYGTWVVNPNYVCDPLLSFFGTGTQTALVLSVDLLSFDANATEKGTILSWTTANEVNNKGFIIERSSDGRLFNGIGELKGSNKPDTYQFVDNAPFKTTYYRLRQMDNDGKETLSKVIAVVNKSSSKLVAYPSVTTGILTVETDLNADFQVVNPFGQQVLSGKNLGRLDVSALPQGAYFLKIGTEQVKFIKQ